MNNDSEKFISIDRIIEGVFVGLFTGQKSRVIVSWAQRGENIPLTCQKCGAVFYTKNINYIGAHTIYYGTDHNACQICKHHISCLKPDIKRYTKGLFE